eukprot:CAMPEP_0197517496 /NCGR_PEP_ID=MMETSP1318-20131121/2529_1 /TAXON_ID=552666 /ORGANISM="Partenskyella glossopodia, Strain RCC365" /LENGTH=110 /DNA_ID=CAMNT_0043067109 /DNA_START=85 /DNA_END=414 /DNA_ORIENTATION=+
MSAPQAQPVVVQPVAPQAQPVVVQPVVVQANAAPNSQPAPQVVEPVVVQADAVADPNSVEPVKPVEVKTGEFQSFEMKCMFCGHEGKTKVDEKPGNMTYAASLVGCFFGW